ncbi:LPXTG cell wall anchor domain-containing protein [Sphingomonas citri]
MFTRNLLVLLASLPLAVPASAQQAKPAPVTTVPPADSAVPPPISWSLPPGPGATPSAPAVVAPVRAAPALRPTPTPTPRATLAPAPRASATPRAAPTPAPRTTPAPAGVAAPVAAPRPSATPANAAPVDTPSTAESPTAAATGIVPVPPPASAPPAPLWRADWLIAVGLVLIGGVALLLWRRRRKDLSGTASGEVAISSPTAEPHAHRPPTSAPVSPIATAPRASLPASPAASPPRARLTVALRPRRGGINLLTATLDVELEIVNTGDASAGTVQVAARLLSAHRDQHAELDALFAEPRVRPAVAPFVLAPGEARVLPLLLTLPRAAIRPIDMGGRAMFVPVAAVDVRYGSGMGEAQSAAAFAVGVARDGAAKLAPFRLDGPARMHETLDARPHGAPLTR